MSESLGKSFREVTIPEEWRQANRVRIHFEAVDYHTTVYIDKGTFRNVDRIYVNTNLVENEQKLRCHHF